ncbi:MAG: hypothetical protein IID51_09635 [Proteobacteria bacterium]|nr:hypothetical protein [Pseudomonadota bacterium]
MSSKFSIELAQGTVTVEGDEEFIKSVYQALQATLLSGDFPKTKPVDTEAKADKAAKNAEPEIIPEESAPEESIPEASETIVTPINAAETGQEPASLSAGLLDEGTRAPIEDAAPEYDPIPSVLDPGRAEREKAEAEKKVEEEAEEERLEPTPASRGTVLEQIKESLGDEEDSGSQTSILQRIRDSLSEDKNNEAGEAGEAPRAADAS